MKKYLILATAVALTLAGCAKVETYVVRDGENPIGFTNYTFRGQTRADDTFVDNNADAPLVVGKKFGVYAYATTNGNAWTSDLNATGNAAFMSGVEVTFGTNGDSDATANTYSPLRYWPSGDTPDWLTFWAYYPVQSGNGIVYTAPNGSNGIGTFAFTAAATAATMVDFMVADVVNDKIYGTVTGEHIAVNGVVPLHFHHMLTKVQFKFKTNLSDAELATTKVYLTDAKLINIRKERTLNATYATGTTTTTWADAGVDATLAKTKADYEIFVNGNDVTSADANKVDLTRTATTVAAAEVFLMVPQVMLTPTFSAGALTNDPQILRLNWDVVTSSVTTHCSKDLYFDTDVYNGDDPAAGGYAVKAIDWAKNNFITYTITVGPKPIRFTADVTTWDPENLGYFNVQ